MLGTDLWPLNVLPQQGKAVWTQSWPLGHPLSARQHGGLQAEAWAVSLDWGRSGSGESQAGAPEVQWR